MQPVHVFAEPLQNGVTPEHEPKLSAVHCTHTLAEHTGVPAAQSLLTLQPPLGWHAPFAEHRVLRHTRLAFALVQLPDPSAYPHLPSLSQMPLAHSFPPPHVVPFVDLVVHVPPLHQLPDPHWLSALQLALQAPSA